jgi:hypothetical protein
MPLEQQRAPQEQGTSMKISKIASAAILLWVVTVAIGSWFFIRGNVERSTDNRTAIVLKSGERDLILQEMRGLLLATHGILDGINQGNMALVSKAARSAGMAAAADVNPALMAKLPLPFKSMGMSVHRSMDDMAQAAENGTPAPEILKQLTSTLALCVGCHSTWQLKSGQDH